MVSHVYRKSIKRALATSVVALVLFASSALPTARPALAVCHNCAYQAAYEAAVNATLLATRALEMAQRATGAAGVIGADQAQTVARAKLSQAGIDDARMRVQERQAMQIAMDLSMPPDFNYCGLTTAARGFSDLSSNLAQRAGAFGRAGLPDMSVAAVVENEAVRGRLGFLPCKADGTMEDRLHHRLKCTAKDKSYVNADMSLSAVFARDQMPVPKELAGPIQAGVFVPIPNQDYQDKYVPFLAGYSFCQNLAPKIPKGVSSDKVSIGFIQNTRQTEAYARVAYDMCMRFLLDRAQYEEGLGENAAQAKVCKGMSGVNLMDAAVNSDCKKNGRSKMQLLKDMANMDQASAYHQKFSTMLSPAALAYMTSSLIQSKSDYERLVTRQRDALARAIQVARRGANMPGNANMDIPAK